MDPPEKSKGRARGRGRGDKGRARQMRDQPQAPRPGLAHEQPPPPMPHRPGAQPAPPPARPAWGMRPGGWNPGAVPVGGLNPGAVPVGGLNPGAVPVGGLNPGAVPARGLNPGAVPVGGLNPGAVPVGGLNPGAVPVGGLNPGAVPVGGLNPAAVPAEGMPPMAGIAVPQGARAPGAGAGPDGDSLLPGGRAVRRGTSSRLGEVRPGGGNGADDVQQRLQHLSLEEQGAVGGEPAPGEQQGQQGQGEGVRRRRTPEDMWEMRYGDPLFRSPELVNKKGESGVPVTLRANYFRVSVPPGWSLCQYHVDFLPPVESSKMRKSLLFNHSELLGPVKAFDGMILFLPHRLDQDEKVVNSNRRVDNANIRITIRFRCEVRDVTPSTLQVLNIILRKILAMMSMKQINRHFFDVQNKIPVPKHKLEVIPGYQTSVLYYERETLLDIDLTHKIMRTTTVLDRMYEVYDQYEHNRRIFKEKVTKEIVGLVVMTRYNNKTYTVDDISWDARVSDTFEKDNRDVRFDDYYRSQYNIDIRDRDQPLLVSRAKKRDIRAGKAANIMLVPELCNITGLTESNRADFNLKKDLATHTRVNPDDRSRRLTSFVGQITRNEQVAQELRNWQLGLENQMVSIPSRQLLREEVFMSDGQNRPATLTFEQQEADWSRDMRGHFFKLACNLEQERWLLIYHRKNFSSAKSLVQTLQQVGPPMGMNIKAPRKIELNDDTNETFSAALRSGIQPGIRMVVCILPNNRKDRYDTIKKVCCVESPVPSQMVTDRVLNNHKRLMSVATKIAIQMNCKLGGVIWTVQIPLPTTMVIGLDTYHDSSRRGRSVCAVVASISSDHARYFSTCVFQMSHQELANQLHGCVTACLRAYARENQNRFPQKVIVFRDGVGDGQLNLVFRHEVAQIKDALKSLPGESPLPLTFVVVKKRTNARFFRESRSAPPSRGGHRQQGAMGGGQFANPGPGTVIDDVVTKHDWFDFFLISQSVREGTVTPTHYNVLLNEMKLRPEHIQRLAYKLCHMYYNWQGTIRVPAPCMYAHKMAFLVGQSLHTDPHHSLSRHLYYL